MKKHITVMITVVFALFTISCSLFSGISNLLGGQTTRAVNDLWPDVPRMDGLTKSDIDLPLTARLAIQGFMKASSQGEGAVDFITFTTNSSTQAVTDFYTLEKMQAAGWNLKDLPGCETRPKLMMCFFGKEIGGGQRTLLVIFASVEENATENQVFFARMDLAIMPAPSN
jgi:hypothetical protein